MWLLPCMCELWFQYLNFYDSGQFSIAARDDLCQPCRIPYKQVIMMGPLAIFMFMWRQGIVLKFVSNFSGSQK